MLVLMLKILNSKLSGYVRISKYKNSFAKGYTPNWSEEDFVISKKYISMDLRY